MPEGPGAAPLLARPMLSMNIKIQIEWRLRHGGRKPFGEGFSRDGLLICQCTQRGQRAWGDACTFECLATNGYLTQLDELPGPDCSCLHNVRIMVAASSH